MGILVLRPNARQKAASCSQVAGLPQGFWRLGISGETLYRVVMPSSSMDSSCHPEPATMTRLAREPSFRLRCGCGTAGGKPGSHFDATLAGVLEMAKVSIRGVSNCKC